ncbi:hypothetical protein HOA92_03650 [archaeon]|jgi:hypothetical protein|nr:hypothetical protein [archaeon]
MSAETEDTMHSQTSIDNLITDLPELIFGIDFTELEPKRDLTTLTNALSDIYQGALSNKQKQVLTSNYSHLSSKLENITNKEKNIGNWSWKDRSTNAYWVLNDYIKSELNSAEQTGDYSKLDDKFFESVENIQNKTKDALDHKLKKNKIAHAYEVQQNLSFIDSLIRTTKAKLNSANKTVKHFPKSTKVSIPQTPRIPRVPLIALAATSLLSVGVAIANHAQDYMSQVSSINTTIDSEPITLGSNYIHHNPTSVQAEQIAVDNGFYGRLTDFSNSDPGALYLPLLIDGLDTNAEGTYHAFLDSELSELYIDANNQLDGRFDNFDQLEPRTREAMSHYQVFEGDPRSIFATNPYGNSGFEIATVVNNHLIIETCDFSKLRDNCHIKLPSNSN